MPKYSLVHIGPDNWFNFKADPLFGTLLCLQEIGLDIDFKNNQLSGDRVNIINGVDFLVQSNQSNFLKEKKLDYFILEGEYVQNRTINGRLDFNFELYLDYLANAKGIITPFISNVGYLQELGLSAQYYRFGDFPNRIKITRPDIPNFDFGFYGLNKGDRVEFFEKLKGCGHNIFIVDEKSPFKYRDLCLSQCSYQLSISSKPAEVVNPIRILEAVGNGIPIFHNHLDDDDGYLEPAVRLDERSLSSLDWFVSNAPELGSLQNYTESHRLIDGLRNIDF